MYLCTRGRNINGSSENPLRQRKHTEWSAFSERLLWQWPLKTRIREPKKKGTLCLSPWRSSRNFSLSQFWLLKLTLQGTCWTLLCGSCLQKLFWPGFQSCEKSLGLLNLTKDLDIQLNYKRPVTPPHKSFTVAYSYRITDQNFFTLELAGSKNYLSPALLEGKINQAHRFILPFAWKHQCVNARCCFSSRKYTKRLWRFFVACLLFFEYFCINLLLVRTAQFQKAITVF